MLKVGLEVGVVGAGFGAFAILAFFMALVMLVLSALFSATRLGNLLRRCLGILGGFCDCTARSISSIKSMKVLRSVAIKSWGAAAKV